MASILKVDDLRGNTSAGDVTITGEGTATMRLSQGVAKHWAKVNQTNATILDSFNTDSITDVGTGRFRQTFTNNMNNANYSIAGSTSFNTDPYTQHQFRAEATTHYDGYNSPDQSQSIADGIIGNTVHGDLA